MSDYARPRIWSPNWGIGVFFISAFAGGTIERLFERGNWLVGILLEVTVCAACTFALGRLERCRRREWGAFALPFMVGWIVSDVFAPEAIAGWWIHMFVWIGIVILLRIPLDRWLAHRDRVRFTSLSSSPPPTPA